MEPMTGYSQVSMPADSPRFYFALSIILPLFLSTIQALTFALHHVGEEMSYKLINEIVKGWLVGAAVGIVVHTFVRGAIRVSEDVLYFLAWVTGSLVRTVRIFVEKLVRGFRAGKGNDI
jgi:Na+-translocating ferredoxin:NAD+ oxidoreductase RnfA subunit